MLPTPFLLICLAAGAILHAPFIAAAPVERAPASLGTRAPTHDIVDWLCGQPYLSRTCDVSRAVIAKISNTFAAGASTQDARGTATMPLGRAAGAKLAGVTRYTLPYAKAPVGSLRFQPPASLASWSGILDATNLPPACPQSSLLSPTPSSNEDCLFMNVFVPTTAKSSSKLPVFVWLHGGSFVSGSTSDAAIDGSLLAEQGNLVVVTMQYRLGMLGFLHAPSSDVHGNMAVLDVIEGLTFIRRNVAAFGGDPASVTLAGQSSGASLIKTLLTVSRADALFHKVILQSAPLAYADHSSSTATAVGQLFTSQPGIEGCGDLACLQALPVAALLAAQDEVFRSAPFAIGPQVSAAEPIRPFVDGSTVVQQFERVLNTGGLNNKNRPTIITTTRNEAGPTIAGITSDAPLPAAAFPTVVQALLDPSRSAAVLASGLYPVSDSEPDSARTQLELLGTDLIWRCPAQQTAVNATRSGNAEKGVWLAEFDLGIPYTSNLGIKFCQGKVCHQDDIEAVFATGGDDTTQAQQALEKEIAARWASFAHSGSPNPSGTTGYLRWDPVSVSRTSPYDVHLNMLQLDGARDSIAKEQRKAQCGPDGLFGARVPFDQQVYSAA